ncbi:hypothetical protein HDU91_000505 [Kappamyces sp. JEL0680]|nr:hypothetical protein HDU91_000505 [Kappamyces sp. JEL0680]
MIEFSSELPASIFLTTQIFGMVVNLVPVTLDLFFSKTHVQFHPHFAGPALVTFGYIFFDIEFPWWTEYLYYYVFYLGVASLFFQGIMSLCTFRDQTYGYVFTHTPLAGIVIAPPPAASAPYSSFAYQNASIAPAPASTAKSTDPRNALGKPLKTSHVEAAPNPSLAWNDDDDVDDSARLIK